MTKLRKCAAYVRLRYRQHVLICCAVHPCDVQLDSLCMNDGVCSIIPGTAPRAYKCECLPYYTGRNCQYSELGYLLCIDRRCGCAVGISL